MSTSRMCARSWKAVAVLMPWILLLGCEHTSVTAVDVVSVSVSPEEHTLVRGDTLTLAATPRDPSGTPLPDRPIRWSSEDESVATVTPNGLVEARGAGVVRITASAEGAEATVTLTVQHPPRIVLSANELQLSAVARSGIDQLREVTVTNGGEAPLSGMSVEVIHPSGQPTGWLQARLPATGAPTSLVLTLSTQALEAGVYRAEVHVSAPKAENSPETLAVELDVAARPTLQLSRDSVAFEITEGQSPPPAQVVQVRSSGPAELGELTVSGSPGAGTSSWLQLDLERNETPTSVAVALSRTDLTPGLHRVTVNVHAPGAHSPVPLAVSVAVSPRVDPQRSTIRAVPESLPADGTSTSAIFVQLRDARGAPILTGGAHVTISTTAGTVGAVSDLETGTYHATLRAPSAPGTGVVTARVDGILLSGTATVHFTATETPSGDPSDDLPGPDPGDDGGSGSDEQGGDTEGGSDPEPSDGVALIQAIRYLTAGNGQHLRITVSVADGLGAPIPGVAVSAALTNRDTDQQWTLSATTGSLGTATLGLNHHPPGCYTTTVLELSAAGITWNGVTPTNGHCTDPA